MPSFKFRLQPLLDQKLEAEKAAKSEVARKLVALQHEQRELAKRQEQEQSIQRSLAEARQAVLPDLDSSVDRVQQRSRHIDGLKQDLAAAHDATLLQEFAVDEAERQLEKAKRVAIECGREVEVLTKYREKLERRFAEQANQLEQREHDEMANITFLSRSKSS